MEGRDRLANDEDAAMGMLRLGRLPTLTNLSSTGHPPCLWSGSGGDQRYTGSSLARDSRECIETSFTDVDATALCAEAFTALVEHLRENHTTGDEPGGGGGSLAALVLRQRRKAEKEAAAAAASRTLSDAVPFFVKWEVPRYSLEEEGRLFEHSTTARERRRAEKREAKRVERCRAPAATLTPREEAARRHGQR